MYLFDIEKNERLTVISLYIFAKTRKSPLPSVWWSIAPLAWDAVGGVPTIWTTGTISAYEPAIPLEKNHCIQEIKSNVILPFIAESSPTPNVVTRAYRIITNKILRYFYYINWSTYTDALNTSISISSIRCIQFIAIVTPLNTTKIYFRAEIYYWWIWDSTCNLPSIWSRNGWNSKKKQT